MAAPFLCLRRFKVSMADAVSMPSAFFASLFEWLRRFCIKGFNDSMLSCAVDFISTECF
jgi:hypothetical protein